MSDSIRARITGRWRGPQGAELDRLLRETIRGVGEDSELIFQAHALHKTGRMMRGITSRFIGGDVIVTAEAKDPLTGFDYVRITRFGHRVARIYPRADRPQATVLETGSKRARGGRAALRFTIGGRVLYRRSVRGFHPAQDWASTAMPQVRANADRAMQTLGRRIVVSRF